MKHYLLILILPILLLTGCDSRDQPASEAIVGVETLADMIGTQEGYLIARGVTDNILAARGVLSVDDLPPANWTPRLIREEPETYADDAKEAKEANASGFWAMVGGGALAAVALLAGAVRSLGVGGPIAQLAAGIFLSKTQKQTKKYKEALAEIAPVVIQAVEVANADNVKDLVKTELDGKAILNDIIQQLATLRPAPVKPEPPSETIS